MAKRPQIRKFEMGASAMYIQEYLEAKGYRLQYGLKNSVRLLKIGGGRPKNMSRKALIAFLDKFRVADGLEPIVKPCRAVALQKYHTSIRIKFR